MKVKFKFNRAWSRGALPPGDRRLWLGFRSLALRIQLGSTNTWLFEVFYRRLLVVGLVLALALWLAAAAALYSWLNRVPFNQVRWVDIAAPWRWPEMRVKRGDTAVLAALDALARRDFANAFFNLRAGIARAPGNIDGRIALARLQAPYDPVRGIATMEEGIPYAYNNARFITALMAIYASQQIQEPALATVDAILSGKHGSLDDAVRLLLEQARVKLLVQLSRLPEAETAAAALLARDATQAAFVEGVRIEILLRSNRPAEAREIAVRRTATDPVALRQAVEIAVALEDQAALQSALLRLKANSPVEPGPYLLAFQSWHRLNRLTYRDQAEQEYFQLFAQQDAALQALAALAVNLNLSEVVIRAQRVAVAANLSPFAFRVHRTELALRNRQIDEAMRLERDWERDIETLKSVQRFYPEFIKRLTRTVFTETPDQLNSLLAHLTANRAQATLPVFTLAVEVLSEAKNFEAADRVLQVAQKLYPQSAPVLRARYELEPRLAELRATAERSATVAAAAQPVAATVALPESAEQARSQIEAMFEADQLVAARDMIRAVRSQKPAWFEKAQNEVAALDVELALLTLDQLSSRSLLRSYLDRYRSEADALRLVGVVSRLTERKREADARLLYDELMNAVGTTVEVQRSLRALNLADDLAQRTESEAAALKTLDAWIVAQEWAQAERLLKHLKENPPQWLKDSAAPLKAREIRVRLGLAQRPQALAVFRDLVLKAGEPRTQAFALVGTFVEAQDYETASLLAREVARLLPEDPEVAKLLKSAEAPIPTEG